MGWTREWAPYVPVAERKKKAAKAIAARAKKGLPVDPVTDVPRKIATTAWGKAWCDGLESHADFEYRLERGRTYVRNGFVVHLAINAGSIEAIVSGSDLYTVSVKVKAVPEKRWRDLISRCAGHARSALDVLRGKLSPEVMALLSGPKDGLIPIPGELAMRCSCPDGASLCKHVGAALYGVGARLDRSPEMLFVLRGVSASDLVVNAKETVSKGKSESALAADDSALEDLFGIDLGGGAAPAKSVTPALAKKASKKSAAPAAATSATKAKPAKKRSANLSAADKIVAEFAASIAKFGR